MAKKDLTVDELLRGIDGRTWQAKKLMEVYSGIVADLGGPGNITVAEAELIRRAAIMAVLGQGMDMSYINGGVDGVFDFEKYMLLARSQMTILKSIGLNRREKVAKEASLAEYLRKKREEPEPEDVEE